MILPIAIYASETWVLTVKEEDKLNVFEMRCLRAILGVSKRDRISNASIRKSTNAEQTITDLIRTRRLKWFGHVCRKPSTSFVYQSYKQDFPQPRPRGRPPKRWTDHIRKDTKLPILTAEGNAKDRSKWAESCRRGVRGH